MKKQMIAKQLIKIAKELMSSKTKIPYGWKKIKQRYVPGNECTEITIKKKFDENFYAEIYISEYDDQKYETQFEAQILYMHDGEVEQAESVMPYEVDNMNDCLKWIDRRYKEYKRRVK